MGSHLIIGITMNSLVLPSGLLTLLLVSSAYGLSGKAASPLLNIGCQCTSPALTYLDSQGVTQGNCLTIDHSGARWCYVDLFHSTCQDLRVSQRFQGKAFSYEACATPPVQAPFVAPVHSHPLPVPVPAFPQAPHHHHQQPIYPQQPAFAQQPHYPGAFIGA